MPEITRGVLVAANFEQEWMLKWWYNHYTMLNDYPICFADFGMSKSALNWCKTKGLVISIDASISPTGISPQKEKLFKKLYYGDVHEGRKAWFLKPFAMQKSPFEKTIWIDVDCKVRSNLNKVFTYSDNMPHFSLARDLKNSEKMHIHLNTIPECTKYYNSGVISFRNDAIVLKKWIENIPKYFETYLSDQEVLSHTIHENAFEITELPKKYNYLIGFEVVENPSIIHYATRYGKDHIKKEIYL